MKRKTIHILAIALLALILIGYACFGREDASPAQSFITEFSTVDFYGQAVDESIISGKEYTMINFWASFCKPCKKEMPEIQKIYGELPDNIGIVGVCLDAIPGRETFDTAKEILEECGVTYTNLTNCPELAQAYDSISDAVPVTVFVNSRGEQIGDVIIGADTDAYREVINSLK